MKTIYFNFKLRLVVALSFFCANLFMTAQVSAASVFNYPRVPEFVVIEYTQVEEMLENTDSTPRLRIYGDGRVLVHYPDYMKRAGDYEMFLSDARLQQLLVSLEQKSIFGLTSEKVTQLKQQAAVRLFEQSSVVTERSDNVHSVININLGSYISSATGIVESNFKQSVSLKNISWNAQRFPEVVELKNAATAEVELSSFLNHPDLKKTK